MVAGNRKGKLALLTFLSIILVSMVAADSNWTIEKNSTLSQQIVSPESPTIQVINISAENYDTRYEDPTMLTPGNISEGTNTTYTYNKSEGIKEDLQYMGNEFWYAKFNPTQEQGTEVFYAANGTTPDPQISNSNQEANTTDTLTLGDFKLELQNNYENQKKAGRQFEMEVAVTNVTDGGRAADTDADVSVYFQNKTATLANTDIDNYENGLFYNSRVNYPDDPNSRYLMHVIARDTNNNINGSTTRIIDLAPSLQGQITEFSAEDGCNTENMVSNCEQGSTVNMQYQVNNAEAENVNMSIYAFNESGRHRIQTMNLTENGNTYTGQVNVPDLNTSKYRKEMEYVFNATNNYRRDVERTNITLESFKIQDRSPPTTYIGQEYNLQIFLGKPITLENYRPDRFNSIEINITDANETQIALFDKETLSYSSTSGTMQGSLVIDEENPTGSYGLEITATNKYGEEKTLNSGFNVRSPDATFAAQTDNEWEINRITPQTFAINIENLLDEQHELESEVTKLSDQLTVLNESIILESDTEEQVYLEAELEELNDKEGSIKFIDESTNYNETVQIDIKTPNCQLQTGRFCSKTSSVDTSASTSGTFTETITLQYIGEEDGSETINSSIEGEIGQHLSIQDENMSIDLSGEQDITLEFTPQAQGLFEGQVVFEDEEERDISVPVSLNYNEDEVDNTPEPDPPQFSLSQTTIDLGTVVEGETATASIEIENTGNSTINTLTMNSNSYTTSINSEEIEAGQTAALNIEIGDVVSSEASVDITAENEGDETTETLTVTASPIQNYGDRTNELDRQIRDLQSSAPEQYQSNLTQASTQVTEVQTQWERGNYEQARATYTEIETTLATIEAQTTTTGETPNQQESNNSLLLPLIMIITILLIAGFTLYESYIPEKGDPLYNVLGDKQ